MRKLSQQWHGQKYKFKNDTFDADTDPAPGAPAATAAAMRLCLVGGLILFGAGCTSHHTAPPAPNQPSGEYKILLSTQPTIPRQLDPTLLTAQVTEKNGKPVLGASVTAQLTMPSMDMGRNEVALHEATAPPGAYLGTGRFTMPGDWQVVVQINKNGQQAEQTITMKVQ